MVVQVSVPGGTAVRLNLIVGKEITLRSRPRGTQRFIEEFDRAVEIIRSREIDIRPVVMGSCPLADALAAFEAAGDRSRAVKVQIAFAEIQAGPASRAWGCVGERFPPRQDAPD